MGEQTFDSAGSEGPLPEPIEARIAEWRPAGLGHAEALPAWVPALRRAVAAARPRNAKECGNALRWGGEYLEFRAEQGLAVEGEAVWAEDEIDKFMAVAYGLAKTGTRDAAKSHLRRTHPAIGYAGTTRRTSAPTNPVEAAVQVEPAPEPVAVAAPPARAAAGAARHLADASAAIPARVLKAINGYQPQRLAIDRWELVEGYARNVVIRMQPMTGRHARSLLYAVGLLAAWTHHQAMPVRDDVVFDAANIEALLTQLLRSKDVKIRSVATYSSNLHAARELLGIPLDVERRQFPKAEAKGPYSDSEVAAVFAQAACVPGRARRRQARAALHLLFGAGLAPGECALVRPGDIRKEGHHALVTVNGREVAVLDDYVDAVLADKRSAAAAAEEWMLGGGSSRGHRFHQLMRPRQSSRWGIDVDSTQGRRTWALEVLLPLAETPGGLAALRQLAASPLLLEVLANEVAA